MWNAVLAFLKLNQKYIGLILAGALGISFNYGIVDDKTAGLLATVIGTWAGILLAHKGGKVVATLEDEKRG